ncbi:hypothetical protein [Thalassospira indica]|nr:hypothetical protein [Thalassospira indica]
MALLTFTTATTADTPIKVLNHRKHRRDFTYDLKCLFDIGKTNLCV